MSEKKPMKTVTYRLGNEDMMARELAPLTVLKYKNALIRQCLQENLVATANKYLRPDERRISKQAIENAKKERGNDDIAR